MLKPQFYYVPILAVELFLFIHLGVIYNLLILCKLCGAAVKKNTVKEVSYSCMQNMSSIIKSQNKKVINKDAKELNPCN